MNPSLSRVRGCLLGGALGDALGYPVEFLRTEAEIRRVLGYGGKLPRQSGGKAVISDDTQMSLFTAEGLVRARYWTAAGAEPPPLPAILAAYHRWLFTQTGAGRDRWTDPSRRGWLLDVPELQAKRAPGQTCVSALEASVALGTLPTVLARPNDSKGCGAVIRSAPIGLAVHDVEEAFALGRDAALLTHGHPCGYLSAAYFAAVVHLVAREIPLPSAMKIADDLLRGDREGDEVAAAVDGARAASTSGDPADEALEKLGEGWVGEEALGIALLCALTTEDSRPPNVARSLRRAVSHAGDSDSTGSLTGNLLGAMHGVDALPTEWLEDLELCDVIEAMARDLHATCILGHEPDPHRYPHG